MFDTDSPDTISNPSAPDPSAQPSQPQPAQPASPAPAPAPAPAGPSAAEVTSQPSRPPVTAAMVVNPAPPKKHPIGEAIHDLAETLAGGPQYRVVSNPDGSPRQERVALSGKHLAMAIALEALTGGLAGLAAGRGKGPGAAGAAGVAQGERIVSDRRKREHEEFEQAAQQYSRRAQVLELNMTLRHNAQIVGRMDRENNEQYVAQWKSLVDKLQQDYPQAVRDVARYEDFAKYNVTADSAIPYRVVPRRNPDGTQATSTDGVPKWDIDYLVIDPHFKADDLLTEEDRQTFNKYRLIGFANSDGTMPRLPESLPMRLSMAMGYHAKAAGIRLAENDLGKFYAGLNKFAGKGTSYEVPNLVAAIQADPKLPDTLTKFHAFYSQTGSYETAIAQMAQKDPDGAGKIAALLGGKKALQDYRNEFEGYESIKDANQAQSIKATARKGSLAWNQANDFLNSLAAQKGKEAGEEAKAKNPYEMAKMKAEHAVMDGDPEAAAQLLVNGDVAPSQIISSRKPAFAQAAFSAAKRLKPGWNSQEAEGYFKAAANASNVVFFGSAKSLTDKGGTLDQLAVQHAKLGNARIPLFNKWKDYADYQTGNPAMAGFMQTAIGVADDYAKVMGGGGQGSDTSRLQVLKSFANAHNPEQMAAAIQAARDAVNSQMTSRIGSNPVMKRMYGSELEQQPSAAPSGATMKVPGSDGKMHWSDGKRDLGVVQ